MLCVDGQSLLLSCNRQQMRISDGRVALNAIEVNAPVERRDELAKLAARIATALPGFWGYVGVDLVMNDRGPVVLEVNPRLTTSYCGLGRALGISVAAMVLDLLAPGAPARWRRPAGRETVGWTWRRPVPDDAVIGWDLGGAHLKAARLDASGRVLDVIQVACPLWQGLQHFHSAVDLASRALGSAPRHAVTMTGEMVDLFANRWEGVSRLVAAITEQLAGRVVRFYAGSGGFLDAAGAIRDPGGGCVGELDGERRTRRGAACRPRSSSTSAAPRPTSFRCTPGECRHVGATTRAAWSRENWFTPAWCALRSWR